jgi:hypothetical protein
MRHKKNVERRRAIYRGLEFIYQTACDPSHFEMYGHDYLGCFHCIASTSLDVRLCRMARRMGQERARHWRREHAKLTPASDADEVAFLVFGSYAADQLGVPDNAFREDLRAAAQRFGPQDYFGFDPAHEPPAADLPEECKCGAQNIRGRQKCYRCKRLLYILSPYAIWVDALTRSYMGEQYGVKLGASLHDVVKWLPKMRPYPTDRDDIDFYWALYAVTHVVYTLNDYSLCRLSPRYLPDEFEFLKLNLRHFIDVEDAESTGELLDTLKSFGLSETHPLIIEGVDFLLADQNSDGSWGHPKAKDIYERYHPTWTAIDGLREYAWPGGLRRQSKSFPLSDVT